MGGWKQTAERSRGWFGLGILNSLRIIGVVITVFALEDFFDMEIQRFEGFIRIF